MNTYYVLGSVVLLASCSALNNSKKQISLKPEIKSRPNIIYILADDLGYGDLSFLGQKEFKTPNIDKLASEGMTFTQHYAGSAVSGPSRCCLMTGQHTGNAAIRGNTAVPGVGVAPLFPHIPTLPEVNKNGTNYTTAMCGRWHLGGELSNQTPFHRGFDYHFGKLSSDFGNKHGVMIDQLWDADGKHINYKAYSAVNTEPMYENGTLYNLSQDELQQRPVNMDKIVTEKAISYIRKDRKQPFFLYVAYSLPHDPMELHEQFPYDDKGWPEHEKAFASMVSTLDYYVGQILKAIDSKGLRENTIIIFTSDNGAHNEGGHDVNFFNSNSSFREYKRSLHDGGIRTPMIVRWPGVIKPETKSDHLSAFWDVMPTVCEIAGAPVPPHTDGISFLPTLLGQNQKKHDYLYWEFNENLKKEKNEWKQAVITKDNWKGIYYIDEDRFKLFNLNNDVSEENDLSGNYPDKVLRIKTYMQESHTPSALFPLLKVERQLK